VEGIEDGVVGLREAGSGGKDEQGDEMPGGGLD